jgi:hypothetical protein
MQLFAQAVNVTNILPAPSLSQNKLERLSISFLDTQQETLE